MLELILKIIIEEHNYCLFFEFWFLCDILCDVKQLKLEKTAFLLCLQRLKRFCWILVILRLY